MTRALAMTAATFAALPPRARGYVVYMLGSRDDEPDVPDEANPYPDGSAEHREWKDGAWAAYLEVLDGEE